MWVCVCVWVGGRVGVHVFVHACMCVHTCIVHICELQNCKQFCCFFWFTCVCGKCICVPDGHDTL